MPNDNVENRDETAESGRVQPIVKPYDRILLTKLPNEEFWRVGVNPRWDFSYKAMSNILLVDECNEYAETKRDGNLERMIRASDFEKYGMKADELEERHLLRRDEAEA